jgi:hypothetical protein
MTRLWPSLLNATRVVQPETILRWHRAGFRAFWRWSRKRAGRPKIDRELRELIRRMSQENPKWGASRIHGELLTLGFEVAQSTVSKYKVQGGSRRRWLFSSAGGHRRNSLTRSSSSSAAIPVLAAPRIAQEIARAIGIDIDKDIVRRVLTLRVAAPLLRTVPDAYRSVNYEFTMDKMLSAELETPHRDSVCEHSLAHPTSSASSPT